MNIRIQPNKLHGSIRILPSKSQAHRLLICAAFADGITKIQCAQTNADIEATADCLRAIGANIRRCDEYYEVTPISGIPASAELFCRESGSTLRFLLPVVGALGIDTVFHMEGRLPYRPLTPLWEELERMGCVLSRPSETTIRCIGKLKPGEYQIDGGISSQYITGLLFALNLLDGESKLTITGKIESKPYIDLTKNALALFGADPEAPGRKSLISPGSISVEGDWSNGAFFIAANALGSKLEIRGLHPDSAQGDRICKDLIDRLLANPIVIDAADIPDLVPILSVVAAANHGANFTNIRRLRIKESDRVQSICEMLHSLGCKTDASENELTVYPGSFHACTINAYNDHRIAMSAAIAATVASGPVTICGAECVTKSYPHFWAEYARTGGIYEQHLR